ncbi:MAG: hypothetical protein K1X55_09500 [Chitinophagales bacterium]|nr:hypothetical protein [Chitinophagales bacterium]
MRKILFAGWLSLLFSVAFAGELRKVYFRGYHLSAYQYPKKNEEGFYFPYYEKTDSVKNYGTIIIDEEAKTITYKYINGDTYTAKNVEKLIRFEYVPGKGNVESTVFLGTWEGNNTDFKFQFIKNADNAYSVKLFSKRNYDPTMLGGEFYNKEFEFQTLGMVPEQL